MNKLTETQSEIVEDLPATAVEIAHDRGYSSTSTVYDHISDIRSRGFDVGQNNKNEYILLESDGGVAATNHVEARRQTSASKQTITRKANEYLEALEREIKGHRQSLGRAVADGGMVQSKGGQDIVIHRTDDHAPGGATI